jgi:hypothetical protein
MMASEFANATFDKWLGQGYGEGGFTKLIDAELQDVREVLDATSRRKLPDGPCWCKSYLPTLGHTEDCQRARQLAKRLRVG